MAAAITVNAYDAAAPAGGEARRRRGLIAWLALAAVAVTIAASGVVFSEPAPVDLLAIGLIVLLPAVGLIAINRLLLAYGALWLIAGACAVFATTFSLDPQPTVTHVAVTLYLYAASFVLAAFVARAPRAHTELILRAWTVAAVIAASAAIIGYFDLVPGGFDWFTLYGRASGTFKDPNVLGAFLVAPIVYLFAKALEARVRGMVIPLAIAGYLTLALFLSFSRGAWFNLAMALALFGYLATATTRLARVRLKVMALLAMGGLVLAGVVVAAISSDQVADLLSERASLDQSYDTGADGRFGGQQKAVGLIADNPLGIGAQEFVNRHHHEEVHNVYLTVLLSAGWLGGGIYLILVVLTLVIGMRAVMRADDARMLLLVAYATFVATALEGLIIDSDHWRHFYLLMAIIWGIASAQMMRAPIGARRPPRLLGHALDPISRRRPGIVGPLPQGA